MNEKEFKALLSKVFNTHMFMSKRDHHTINELLHCLRYDERLKEFNFNITVLKANDECYCIPSVDAFVNIDTLSIWFDDDKLEYEHEYVDDNGYLFYFDNITVYEKEV
jgi:hypothetical protein